MTRLFLISFATGVLASGTLLLAQDRQNPSPAKTETRSATDGTNARVKEFAAGKKIVLDVDNAPDKSYDLTDKDTVVNVPANIKVGDPVKIMERTVNGKKTVDIALDTASGEKHGDQPPPAKR